MNNLFDRALKAVDEAKQAERREKELREQREQQRQAESAQRAINELNRKLGTEYSLGHAQWYGSGGSVKVDEAYTISWTIERDADYEGPEVFGFRLRRGHKSMEFYNLAQLGLAYQQLKEK